MAPARFATGGGHGTGGRHFGAALLDDDTPTPPHARFTWARLARACAVGLLLWGGLMAALVVTYFTFLPSFLSIFAGAPLIETTHGELKFTAPLTGITAAVVGVVLNLAVFFAWHVLWPEATEAAPFGGRFEWAAWVLGTAAAVALFRYQAGIIPVIAGCGGAGLILTFAPGGA